MFFINNRAIFLAIAGLLMVISIAAVAIMGLRFGIDFTGGTLLEVHYPADRPAQAMLEAELAELDLGAFSMRAIDEQGYVVRVRELGEEERAQVLAALSLDESATVEVVRLNTVGPVVGVELRNKSFVAIAGVLLMIILYVAFAFRTVSLKTEEEEVPVVRSANRDRDVAPVKRPTVGVSSWTYGFVAVITLFHDIIIPLGIFAVLGAFMGVEIDILFIMALLAILGYSVNDTIVVFDRVRENLRANAERDIEEPFPAVVGRSLEATYARSINTSLTTLLVLLALLFLGGSATTFFILALTIGVVAGAFSSIAFASPLLVAIEQYQHTPKV
jgi:preprotein translocase subunit SecF